MRAALLYDPRLLCERLAELFRAQRRRASLRGTPAAGLSDDHIDSLELLRLLDPIDPAVIYDIGANVGTWTQLAKAVFPRAEVHAFEPLAGHHDGFARHAGALASVHLHKLALGETAGTVPIRVMSFSDASSVLPMAPAGRAQWQIEETSQEVVPIEPLDAWQARTNQPLPSLIKLDVQGYELGVLRGGTRCLANADAVLVEVSFREFYEGQCAFHEVVAFLAAQGFRLHALGHGTALGRPLVQSDALFVADRSRGGLAR